MEITIDGLDKVVGNFELFVKENRRATKNAMNEIVRKARTATLRERKKDWAGLRLKDFKSKTKPATLKDLESIFSLESKPIPLMKFTRGDAYRGSLTETGKKRSASKVGVKYKLKRKTRTLGKSFIMPSKFNGKRLEVFTHRKSPQGADITAQYSITPTSMYGDKGIDAFIEIFKREFPERYLAKIGQMTHF